MSEKKKSLFEISSEYWEIENQLLNNPENPEIQKELEISEAGLMEKCEKYHLMIRKHAAIEGNIKAEIERLKKLLPRHQGIQNKLKRSLLNAVKVYGPIDGETWRVSLTSSKKLKILNESDIPPWYKRQETVIDKMKIKNDLSKGDQVKGCRIEETYHVKIS